MKAHRPSTASELFAPSAERHAEGVREHAPAGADSTAPAPDFAGELARASVPEPAVNEPHPHDTVTRQHRWPCR